ncbi:MAG TPA: DNA polymerase III subunit alpha [Candidatus Dojkabacteria bacterium]|nr:DNA polymerase III subunit alpha [Candidatus Dojkabacteria bacterium]
MFTHLHLHTEYSLLDATTRIPELITKLQENGMTSCAITDHGNMYGVFKFQDAMKKAGLKPIIGCEVYISPRDMHMKEYGVDNNYNHLILLAKNFTGYKNLMKIVSIAHMEGFYYRPRIDFETLSKYTDGIISLSACLMGPVASEILLNNYEGAKKKAKQYAEIFKDNFYIEIQRNGMEEQDFANERLVQIAKELNLPIVATCDSHYLNKEDAEIQEILWCISDGYTMDDPKRRRMPTNEFYVKTPVEMEKLFSDVPEAVENTQKISDMIEEYDITFERVEAPYLDLPKGKTSQEYFKELTYEGLKRKYKKVDKELMDRVNYELDIIHQKGYDDYFLIVRDFIKFCKDNDIVVGIRGSGCGSVVAYAIDITDIEPIKWELYFERFLNPERPSPPDFDIDIADKRRDEVIQYTVNKYGEDNVKQIGTFSKLQTRQAIRDVARVIGIDLQTANNLSKMVEIVFGKSKSLDYMIEHNPEFAEIINSSEETKHLAEIVRKVSGLCRGVSTHACGILITPKPVVEYCPIQRDAHGQGMGMTQYEMFDIEPLGLMKYDFLGLRNLNVIGACLKKIKRDRNEEVDLARIDYNDKATYDTIKSGHTIGIFQMESEGMKRTVKAIKPDNLEDICYILAAYRPGPMQYISEYIAVKEGKQKPDYIFPELEPVLSVTNGVITYQEQVMKIAQVVAGYSLGRADNLRRAMGKKKLEVMEAEKPAFIEGAVKNGFDKKLVEKLWDKLVLFANYGFNKAHSASYATTAYRTAYLKTHYPLQYMAALLEGDLEKFDRVIIDLKECERLGIQVLPPDINLSGFYFQTENDNAIRFGLGGIKNLGHDIVKNIVSERETNGKFQHLDDFVHRTFDKVNKKAVEYLIMSGAMDSFGNRFNLLQTLPLVYEKEKNSEKVKNIGQFDFFSLDQSKTENISMTPLVESKDADRNLMLQWERELLGMYFSSYPLDSLKEFFESKGVISISEALENKKSGEDVILGVMVTKLRKITTKKGEIMAFLTIEDKTGSTDAIIFPRVYTELKESLKENIPMLILGRINERGGEKSIVVQKAKYVDERKHSSKFDGVTFKITIGHTEDEVSALKQFIQKSIGDTAVKIVVDDGITSNAVILNKTILVDEECQKWLRVFRS